MRRRESEPLTAASPIDAAYVRVAEVVLAAFVGGFCFVPSFCVWLVGLAWGTRSSERQVPIMLIAVSSLITAAVVHWGLKDWFPRHRLRFALAGTIAISGQIGLWTLGVLLVWWQRELERVTGLQLLSVAFLGGVLVPLVLSFCVRHPAWELPQSDVAFRSEL